MDRGGGGRDGGKRPPSISVDDGGRRGGGVERTLNTSRDEFNQERSAAQDGPLNCCFFTAKMVDEATPLFVSVN